MAPELTAMDQPCLIPFKPHERVVTTKHKILIGIILVSLLARLALPHVLLRAINKKLDNFKGYQGFVKDVDVQLYRGAYMLKDFSLQRTDNGIGSIRVKHIHLAFEWKSFLHGLVAGKITVDSLAVQLPFHAADSCFAINALPEFNAVWQELLPIKINRLEIRNGSLGLIDPQTPGSTFSISAIAIDAANLLNGYDSTAMLPATIQAKARICGGNFSLFARADMLANKAKLQLSAILQQADTACNTGFVSHALHTGHIRIRNFSAEASCREGRYEGIVKPERPGSDVENNADNSKKRIEGAFSDTPEKPVSAFLILLPRLFMAAWYEQPEIIHKAVVTPGHEKKKKGFLNKLFKRKKTNRVPKNN